MSPIDIDKAYEFAKYMRIKSLEMALGAGKRGCHIGGSFSCIEILAVLYSNYMRYNIADPYDERRDRFFASKAHCILSHFSVLAKCGFIPESELNSFNDDNGLLIGHPTNVGINLEFSGGSLAMGLSVAIGTALSAKRKKFNYNNYVLLGDGECNEGAIWESLMSASHFKLDNLIIIIDYNNMQFDGTNDEIMSLANLEKKLKAFGCKTIVVDGHSIEGLIDAFKIRHRKKPLAIIAKTIKARGIRRLENTPDSHHAQLTQADYEIAMDEIKRGVYDRI